MVDPKRKVCRSEVDDRQHDDGQAGVSYLKSEWAAIDACQRGNAVEHRWDSNGGNGNRNGGTHRLVTRRTPHAGLIVIDLRVRFA